MEGTSDFVKRQAMVLRLHLQEIRKNKKHLFQIAKLFFSNHRNGLLVSVALSTQLTNRRAGGPVSYKNMPTETNNDKNISSL